MQINTIKTEDKPELQKLFILITIISGLLACWVIFLEHGRLNDDGVLYLEVARLFSIGDWKEAANLYRWPLYPFLISVAHQVTGLSLQYSAHLLSVVFFMATAWAFARLIFEAGGNRRTIIAGVLLLFSCSYIVRNILPMVMREQGFWAFYLLSLLFFLRFYRQKHLMDSIAWQICAIVAMLFRVEGITFLALLPMVLLLNNEISWRDRFNQLVKAYLITTLAIVVVVLVLLVTPSLKFSDLGRLNESITVVHGAYVQLNHGLLDKARIIGENVLGSFLSDYGMQGLILTLFAVIFGKIVAAAGWLPLLLAATSEICALKPHNEAKRIFLWAALLGLLNLWVILLCNFILPSRYAIPMAWIILIFGAFALAALYEKARIGKHRVFWLAIIVLAINMVLSLKPYPAGYNDEQDAVAWIKQNVKPNHRVFYDNAMLRYYAGEPFVDRGIPNWDRVTQAMADGSISQYDYLVIHMSDKTPERADYLNQVLGYKLVASIKSSKNRRILIFAPQK